MTEICRMPGSVVRVSRWSIDFGSIIGHGTFGSVFRARDEEGSGEAVAAKVIDASRMKWEKILAEVKLLNKVAHQEGIVGLYGAHEVSNAHGRAVVMLLELGTGDLLDLLTRKRVLAEAEALRYFREIVGAVEFLHTQRIAHRDLKLENVLISASGACKLADFGLAHEYVGERDLDPRAVPGRPSEGVGGWREREVLYDVCGSKAYVAPEVLLKLGYDGYSADMWSLGICLFAMLAGFFPFTEAVAHNAYFTGAQKQAAAYGSLTLAVFGLYNTPPCPLSLLAVELIDQLLRVSPVLRCSAADALAFTRVAESGIDGQLATAALEAAAAALPLMLPPHDSPEQEVSCSTPGSSSTSSYMSTCDSITDHIDMACPERLEPRSGQASPLGKSACPSCCGWRCR